MVLKKSLRALPVLLALLPILAPVTPTPARADTLEDSAKSKLSGHVDWSKNLIYATGLGAIPKEEPNDAVAYLKARSFARMDARRNLLAVIDHVRIDSQTVGQDFQAVNDTVREEISGIIKGSEIFAERKLKVGNGELVEVTITMPLYGEESLGSAVLPAIAKRNKRAEAADTAETADAPRAVLQTHVPDENAPVPAGAYTGLIIDARGRNVERSMSPKIRRADGSEIWGTLSIAPEFVIENGIVAYARSVAEAQKNTRVGSNPLIIRAAGRYGNRFKTDATLADTDIDILLAADSRSGFLNAFKVIFVVDDNK